MGASSSRPPLNIGKNVREFYTLQTTLEDASAQLGAIDVIAPIDDTAVESTTYDLCA